MKSKKVRNIKVISQSGRNYKPTPTVILKGQWLNEMGFMDKQMVSFAVETENGIVKRIGRLVIAVPEVKFRGGKVKWQEDKYKKAKS